MIVIAILLLLLIVVDSYKIRELFPLIFLVVELLFILY